jgi:hypothetical protein
MLRTSTRICAWADSRPRGASHARLDPHDCYNCAASIGNGVSRIREVLPDWHKIGLEVGMQIRPETVSVAPNSTPHLNPLPARGGEGDTANGKIHPCQFPSGGACVRPPVSPITIGCRHHLLGGGPKLGFEVEGGAVGLFLVISFGHASWAIVNLKFSHVNSRKRRLRRELFLARLRP